MDGLQDTKYEKSMLLVGYLLDATDFTLGHSILVCQLDTRERHPDYRETISLIDDVVHEVDDGRLAGTSSWTCSFVLSRNQCVLINLVLLRFQKQK